MKSLIRALAVCGFVAMQMLPARTQAQPANDEFANAITLNGPIVTAVGSNVGATKPFGGGGGGEPSIPPPSLGTFGGASVWWNWTAAASGQTTIDTEGSSFNTLLGVFTGEAANRLTLVAGNDDFEANPWSRVVFNAVAGTTYRIMVDGFRSGPGFGSPATGSIKLNVKGVGGLTITTPTNGMVFTVGDPIPMALTVDADFPNPPATRVDFYLGDTLVSSSTTAPFTAVASNAPAGSNRVYAIAYDSASTPIQSAVIPIFVQSIGVTLLTPFDGTTFLDTNPITVTAWAYLPSGSITNIEFFVNNQKFADSSAVPFGAVWSNVVSGSHRLTAVGRSDTGAAYNSQPVNIAVAQVLVASNSVWKYLDDGSDQGIAWYASDFNDSAWASGPAPLGFGDSNGRLPLTTNSFGPDPNAKFTTTYFRQSFVASNLASYTNIVLSLQRDDGAIVYLNGTELSRFNMPTGMVTSATFAASNAGDDGGTTFTLDVASALFTEGTNVFAVEIHQDAGTSSDIWFVMQLLGVPPIIRNLSPLVVITNLVDGQFFLGPPTISIAAEASDPDGAIAQVEFIADGIKLGEDVSSPYSIEWSNPPFGPHRLTAVATDEEGGSQISSAIHIVVYDAAGTPFARITGPPDGAAIEGGTNLLVSGYASAPTGVTNVQFFANGLLIGEAATAPYGVVWNAPFGSNGLTAVAFDVNGVPGTSAVVSVTVFPNTIAPTVATQIPLASATVTNLTTVTVTFSERVQNVDASDLLVNGLPATNVTGSGATYLFTFAQPPYGAVAISWAGGHGITDFGFPADLPFNELGTGAQWNYDLIDRTPPTVAARVPAAGSTATNLQQVRVTFSEPVTGVDAADLIVAGTPAFNVSGGGTEYTFLVSQPNSGTVNVSWATNHGIFDQALTPNAFNGAGGGWSFLLDTRTVLVQSNSVWRFVKGTDEDSPVGTAWRQPVYDDSSWSNSPAPFFFGDPYTNFPAGIYGTELSDMNSNYSTIYLRKEFTVTNRSSITNLLISHQSDDGFIAWLNGVEVLRYNMPTGELSYTATATATANEPNQVGAAYISVNLTNGPALLVEGVNVLAVLAANQSLTASSDFGFNAQLYTFIFDPGVVSPRLLTQSPAPGDLLYLTNITVTFSEGVSGVDATDLLVNGVPATGLASGTNTIYTFSFPQPAYGPVAITWAANHGILDFDSPPKPFDGNSASSTFNYTLFNPGNPRIATQVPLGGTIITSLTSIAVSFTEPVAGVEASDLLVNSSPAVNVSSVDQITWSFTVTQPPYGNVAIRWATNHGIQDLDNPANAFDPTRFGGQWNYSLVNPVPTVTLISPTNGAFILAPATIPLRANATDADGTIARVEFFQGTGKLGEATTAPYTFSVPDLDQGAYTFRAIATDNSGLTATSAPVSITVVTSLPIVLVRGPYLQIGTSTSGVVRWRSDLFSDAVVYYGTDPDNLTNVTVRASKTNEHIIRISGLEPETRYYYSIGNSAQRLAGGTDYWFNTAPPPGSRQHTRFWALGDAGTAGNGPPERQQSTRDAFYNFAATNGPTDLVLMLGDNAYNSGQDSEYQAAVFDMYPTALRNKFLWPTLGNHETSQSTTATDFPYLHIFSLPKDGEAGGVASGTELYYSFDYGNIHFVCLDSMTSGRTATTPMAQWLQTDLETTTQEWIVVFFHHSVYTKGTHDSDAEGDLVELRQNILPILEAHGVDIVLNGHSHVYERSYLLDGHYGFSGTLTASMKIDGGDGREDGTGAYRKNADGRGVVYTIAGSSGQALGGPLNHPAHFISLNELGSVVIDVSSNRLDALFLNANGVTRDHYTLRKPTPPPAPIDLVARALGASEIVLSWTDSSTNEAGYIVERSLDGTDFTRFATNSVDVTNALDSGLLVNTTYFYRVRAFNDLGESDPSNVASATTVFATSAPAAPIQLVVSADNAGEAYRSQIFLRWRDRSSNETGFLIERSEDGYEFSPFTTVGANVTLFVDRHLDSATMYSYRVRSINAVADSAPSNLDSVQTHPQNDLVVAGETTVFHAGVEGVPPLRYQWRFMGNAIPGATNEALVVANAQAADEGAYTVVVTEAGGPVTSNPAWLFVLLPPSIVEDPASRTNLIGSTATFQVVAGGTTPLFYQWRKNGSNLPGSSAEQLVLAPVSWADEAEYDVVVMNEFGSVTSRVARLTVSDNQPPVLTAVPDYLIHVLTPFTMTNLAADPDLTNRLTYTLQSGAPTNATLNPTSGVFRWTPSRAQAPGTNIITVRVDDNGIPNLSDTKTFTLMVNDFLEVSAGSVTMSPGATSSVPIDVFSSAGLLDLQVVLELPGDRLTDFVLEALAPERVVPSLVMSNANTALLTFSSMDGYVMQGTQQVARLHFTAVPGQASSFAPLSISAINMAMENTGYAPTLLANDGRVVVLGAESLLEGRLSSAGQRQLLVYGKLGTNYTLQSRFGFGAGTSWANRIGVMVTNVPQTVIPPSATAPLIYFRLRQ